MTPFNWRGYFVLAKNLSKSTDEANLRSSVSRAYYSAYCLTRNHAVGLGYKRQNTAEEHGYIVNFFINRKSFKNLGQNLNRLRRSRNNCDYDDIVNNLPDTTKMALLQCEAVLKQLP